jgi:hypothetical protein
LENSQDWIAGNGTCAWNVATGDIDNDETVEIVTVGCMYTGALCDPDMRIWSIKQEPASIPFAFLVSAGVLVAAVSVVAFFLVRKRRRLV